MNTPTVRTYIIERGRSYLVEVWRDSRRVDTRRCFSYPRAVDLAAQLRRFWLETDARALLPTLNRRDP